MEVVEEKLLQWETILDQAKYLGTEFRYKEKDYGLHWRTAFKEELEYKVERLIHTQKVKSDSFVKDQRFDFYFNIIVNLVERDYLNLKQFLNDSDMRGL